MTSLYPWYTDPEGDEIEQGDLFESCPVYMPTVDAGEHGIVDFQWEERDLIVLSRTCDLVKGREKLREVLLSSVWNRSELTTGHLSTPKGLEDARRGNLPGFHVLAKCDLVGLSREVRVVDFRRVYSLPLAFLRKRALLVSRRLRLLPPYREHLSQGLQLRANIPRKAEGRLSERLESYGMSSSCRARMFQRD